MFDKRVDIAWLAAFRALFGVVMAVSALRFLAYGWIDDFWVKPTFHFSYMGFEWVKPLSPWGMHAAFWTLAGLALAMAVGLVYRAAAFAFVVLFTYVQLLDVATYLNHYYLAALLALLLAVSPAHRAYSVDAWLARRRRRAAPQEPPAAKVDGVRAVWLYVFRFQVAVVYTFAGIAKLHADWLLDAQPLRIWLSSRTDLPLLGPLFSHAAAPYLMSWAGFLFDTSIAWLLLLKRVRPFAYAVVVVFHVVTRTLFPIGMFPVIMVLAALVFFPPDWPRHVVAWSMARIRRVSSSPAVASSTARPAMARVATAPVAEAPALGARWRVAGWAILAVYALCQLALPLRFLAYGGNVRWHEQGMRFSWRVMVREKNGSVTFVVQQKAPSNDDGQADGKAGGKPAGKIWHVSPGRYLTPLQEREMAGQPDLIAQLARHIKRDFEARGVGPVAVHVDALASLNGRPLARLVDPAVDLSEVDDGLAIASWILPAPEQRPPHLRPL